MAHPQQQRYVSSVKTRFPHFFKNGRVLDVGSLDINGNNRGFFYNCIYTGLDIAPGPNVDVVSPAHEYKSQEKFDTIISTECLEHDKFYELTLKNCVDMLRSGGLFVFTCATTGRPEHGTRRTDTYSSPLTCRLDDWGDYYKNLTEEDIRKALDIASLFSSHEFMIGYENNDLYFYGIKI